VEVKKEMGALDGEIEATRGKKRGWREEKEKEKEKERKLSFPFTSPTQI